MKHQTTFFAWLSCLVLLATTANAQTTYNPAYVVTQQGTVGTTMNCANVNAACLTNLYQGNVIAMDFTITNGNQADPIVYKANGQAFTADGDCGIRENTCDCPSASITSASYLDGDMFIDPPPFTLTHSGTTTYYGMINPGNYYRTGGVVVEKLAAPSGVQASTGSASGEVDLSFNTVVSASGYEIYNVTDNVYYTVSNGSTSSYTVTGLTPGATYCFEIRALANGGASPMSSQSCASAGSGTTGSSCNPPNAGSFNHTATSSSITLNWAAVANAASYTVEYRPQGGTWSFQTVSTTTLTISGLSANTPHEFRVSSNCSNSTSFPAPGGFFGPWYVASTLSAGVVCASPSGITHTVNGNSCTVNWNSVAGASSYIFEYREQGGTWSSQTVSSTTITISGLNPNTPHEYRLSTDCGTVVSSVSSIQSFSTSGPFKLELLRNIDINPNPVVTGSPVEVKAVVTNTGQSSFNGTIYLSLRSEGDQYVMPLDAQSLTLAPGNSVTLQYNGQLGQSPDLYRVNLSYAEASSPNAYEGINQVGFNVIDPVSNVDVLWSVPCLTQIYDRNWSTSCMPNSIAMVINYLSTTTFAQNSNGDWVESGYVENPHLTNGQRIYAKGINGGNGVTTNLGNYIEHYPKSYIKDKNGVVWGHAVSMNLNNKKGPLMNELYTSNWSAYTKIIGNGMTTPGYWNSLKKLLNNYNISYETPATKTKVELLELLNDGPVIFSHRGHVIVAVGKTIAGDIIVNDPFGKESVQVLANPPSSNGCHVVYDDNYIKWSSIVGMVSIPVSQQWSPYTAWGNANIEFNKDPQTGVYDPLYDGDGRYDFYDGFSYSGEASQNYAGWEYSFKMSETKGEMVCETVTGAPSHTAQWVLPIRQTGSYTVAVGFVGRGGASTSDAAYTVEVNGSVAYTGTVDQSISDGTRDWVNLTTLSLVAGDHVTVKVHNGSSVPNKKLHVDMVKAQYDDGSPMVAANNLFYLPPTGSIVPNATIRYKSKIWRERSTQSSGVVFGYTMDAAINGQHFIIDDVAYQPVSFDLSSMKIFEGIIPIPMLEQPGAAMQGRPHNLILETSNKAFIQTTPTVTFNVSAKEVQSFDIWVDTLWQPLSVANGQFTRTLTEGLHTIRVRANGLVDSLEEVTTVAYYSSSAVLQASPYIVGDSMLIDAYYSVNLTVPQDLVGGEVFGLLGERIVELTSTSNNFNVPADYSAFVIYKWGFEPKSFEVFADTTLVLSPVEWDLGNTVLVDTADFTLDSIQLSVMGVTVKNTNGGTIIAERQNQNFTPQGLVPLTETVSLTAQAGTNHTTTIAKMAFYQKELLDTASFYLLRNQNKVMPYDFHNQGIIFDTVHNGLYIPSMQSVSESFTLMGRQAPISNAQNFNLSLHQSESTTIALSTLFTDPDAITNDIQVQGLANANFSVSMQNGQLQIQHISCQTGMLPLALKGIHDGLETVDTFWIQVTPLTVQTQVQDVLCHGDASGSIQSSISSSQPSLYNFAWSNGSSATQQQQVTAGVYTLQVTDVNGCTVHAKDTIQQPAPITLASLNVTNEDCDGSNGSIAVSATGGVAGYNYQWANGVNATQIQGLTAGAYPLTITDANACTVVQPLGVGFYDNLQMPTIPNVTVDCHGDQTQSLTANATGPSTISYQWSNGTNGATAQQLGAGVYTVTASTAGGCSEVETVVVFEPAVLEVDTIIANYIPCEANTGILWANGQGGNAGYQYTWSSGDNGQMIDELAPGSYGLTLTDAKGCATTATGIVPTIPLPPNAFVQEQWPNCHNSNDGQLTVNPLSTGNFTFNWSTGATTQTAQNLFTGGYEVTITDQQSGCVTVIDTVLGAPAVLNINTALTPASSPSASDGMVTTTPVGGTAPFSYIWNTGDTTSSLESIPAGSYSVTLTDANGCTTSTTVVLGSVTSTSQLDNHWEVKVYPNPVSRDATVRLYFKAPVGDYTAQLYDALGRLLEERQYVQQTEVDEAWNLVSYPAGTYFFRISGTDAGQSKVLIVK